jgi:hypothetical protein
MITYPSSDTPMYAVPSASDDTAGDSHVMAELLINDAVEVEDTVDADV